MSGVSTSSLMSTSVFEAVAETVIAAASLQSDPTALPRIHRAHSFTQRLLGLLARSPLQADEALFIAPCNSVHTVLMAYAIDVAFVDREGVVLKLVCGLKPYRAAACWGAYGVVEFAAGAAHAWGVGQGSSLDIKPQALNSVSHSVSDSVTEVTSAGTAA